MKEEINKEQQKAQEVVNSIAENLIKLNKAISVILSGKLKRKSLILLLAHSSGLPQYQVNRVLEAITNLEKDHTK